MIKKYGLERSKQSSFFLSDVIVNTWIRQWHPTPVLLPGKSHGPRSLAVYSQWCHKEEDTPE